MTRIQAVIGANYGDEGKGLAVDYLCGQALKEKKKCMVVCSNGGAQRGHTVETPEGERFVFHHLGSGSLLGVGSFFCADYILNPIVFLRDWREFLELTETKKDFQLPPLYADRQCRFSTPFDMMTNQILEDHRGEKRHGSVGVGIWETVRRYEKGLGISAGTFAKMSKEKRLEHIRQIREYAAQRIEGKIGMRPERIKTWKEIWNQEGILERFLEDFDEMTDRIGFLDMQQLGKYDILVIENAQGVLLGQSRYDETNYTTPSDTGAKEIRRLLDQGMKEFAGEIELLYVTRTYLTKHGAGHFEGECLSDMICENLYDRTNIPNGYQGAIRYGHLDPDRLMRQIEEDSKDLGNDPFTCSLLITHANEAPAEPVLRAADAFCGGNGSKTRKIRRMISDGHTRDSVQVL